MSRKIVIGLYDGVDEAHEAVTRLTADGVPYRDISFIAGNSARKFVTTLTQPKNESDRTLKGVAAGTIVGGIAGTLIGIAVLTIPGIGPLLVAGPLYGAWAGLTAGSVAGGLTGAFVRWGLVEEDARKFDETIRNGGALVGVEAAEREVNQISELLTDVNSSQTVKTIDMNDFSAEDTRPSQAVKIETRSTIPTASAEHPVNKNDSPLRAGKLPGLPPVEALTTMFREHYQNTFTDTGKPFEYYLPAYQYGYNLANDDRFREGDWTTIEPTLRQYWDQFVYGKWDEVRSAVVFGRDKTIQRV